MYKMLRRVERQRDWSQRENEEGMRVWLNIQLSTIEIQKKKKKRMVFNSQCEVRGMDWMDRNICLTIHLSDTCLSFSRAACRVPNAPQYHNKFVRSNNRNQFDGDVLVCAFHSFHGLCLKSINAPHENIL